MGQTFFAEKLDDVSQSLSLVFELWHNYKEGGGHDIQG